MAILTRYNLPDEENPVHRERASQRLHAKKPEVGLTLWVAVNPESRVLLGDTLLAFGHKFGLTNEELEVFQQVRDKTPAETLSFD
jgi:plasmid stability protein